MQLTHYEHKLTLKLKRDNMEKIQKLVHDKDVAEIQFNNEEISLETNLELEKIKAETRRARLIPEAQSEKALAQIDAKDTAVRTLAEAKAYEAKRTALADKEAEIIRQSAETRLQVVEDKTEGLLIEMRAEEAIQADLVDKRVHEQRMAQLNSESNFAHRGRMVVSGESGVEMLEQFGKDHYKDFEEKFKEEDE